MFSEELEKYLEHKFNIGVYSTGKKVVDRLLKQYKKP